jgi:Putative amidoligase enzyme
MSQYDKLGGCEKSARIMDDDEFSGEEMDDTCQAILEESLMLARRRKQEVDDAELASDLLVVSSIQATLAEEMKRVEDADLELAMDLATVDTCLQSERDLHAQNALHRTTEAHRQIKEREREQGGWDCPSCTFRNRPYRGHCGACEKASPPHVLAFKSIDPPSQRFGVEFELVVPNGIRDGFSCEWVARELTKLGIQTVFVGYSHETTDAWKVVTDASLSALPLDLCFELVSPILIGEAGLEAIRLMLESVRKIGISINSTCGFHVHVDAEHRQGPEATPLSSLAGLKRVVQCFLALENAFDSLVSRDTSQTATRRRANLHEYCKSNSLALGPLSNKQRWSKIEESRSLKHLVNLVNPNLDRYRKLNLTNLVHHSRARTCEFRQHGGVAELLAAEALGQIDFAILHQCFQTDSSIVFVSVAPELW